MYSKSSGFHLLNTVQGLALPCTQMWLPRILLSGFFSVLLLRLLDAAYIWRYTIIASIVSGVSNYSNRQRSIENWSVMSISIFKGEAIKSSASIIIRL